MRASCGTWISDQRWPGGGAGAAVHQAEGELPEVGGCGGGGPVPRPGRRLPNSGVTATVPGAGEEVTV